MHTREHINFHYLLACHVVETADEQRGRACNSSARLRPIPNAIVSYRILLSTHFPARAPADSVSPVAMWRTPLCLMWGGNQGSEDSHTRKEKKQRDILSQSHCLVLLTLYIINTEHTLPTLLECAPLVCIPSLLLKVPLLSNSETRPTTTVLSIPKHMDFSVKRPFFTFFFLGFDPFFFKNPFRAT